MQTARETGKAVQAWERSPEFPVPPRAGHGHPDAPGCPGNRYRRDESPAAQGGSRFPSEEGQDVGTIRIGDGVRAVSRQPKCSRERRSASRDSFQGCERHPLSHRRQRASQSVCNFPRPDRPLALFHSPKVNARRHLRLA